MHKQKLLHTLANHFFQDACMHEREREREREREVITLWDRCKDAEEQCHGEHGGYTLPACHSLSTSLSLLPIA